MTFNLLDLINPTYLVGRIQDTITTQDDLPYFGETKFDNVRRDITKLEFLKGYQAGSRLAPLSALDANYSRKGRNDFNTINAEIPFIRFAKSLTEDEKNELRTAYKVAQTMGNNGEEYLLDILNQIFYDAGDLVSVFLFKARIAHRNSADSNPYFIDSELALAGHLNINTFAVDGATQLTQVVDFANLPTVVGKYGAIHSTVNGINTSYAAKYTSSDVLVARVDSTGLVQVIGAGTYTITSHIDGATDVVSSVQTVTAQPIATVTTVGSLPIAGSVVLVEGTSLDGINSISIDGELVDEFAVVSATEVNVLVPSHDAGTVEIKLGGYWGNTAVVATGTYA